MTIGSIQITRAHASVLGCVPESKRSAMKSATMVQNNAQALHGMTAESVTIHFGQLHDMGLIELASGYCRRTPDGDRALDPVGVTT